VQGFLSGWQGSLPAVGDPEFGVAHQNPIRLRPLSFLFVSNPEVNFDFLQTKNPTTLCDWILIVGVAELF